MAGRTPPAAKGRSPLESRKEEDRLPACGFPSAHVFEAEQHAVGSRYALGRQGHPIPAGDNGQIRRDGLAVDENYFDHVRWDIKLLQKRLSGYLTFDAHFLRVAPVPLSKHVGEAHKRA